MKKFLQVVFSMALLVVTTFTFHTSAANAQAKSDSSTVNAAAAVAYLNPAQEVKAAQSLIQELQNYKSRNWAIGLNGDTFEPDGFLSFFTQRELPFKYYVRNKGVSIGSSSAYDEDIATLEGYIKKETNAVNSTINELKKYESNYLAIGLNGDNLQPDGFNSFFAARGLEFKPFVRKGSVSIGEPSAYQYNIATLEGYIKSIS